MVVRTNKKGQPPQPETPAEKEVLDELNDDLDLEEDEEGGTRIGGIYIPPPSKPYCSSESKGPRLIIQKIENENFKSYANTVEIGPFHHKFSAVIGPNGSGKSNVIDSMLFVFGCRANKIRASNLKSMIHNSNKYSNVYGCKVAIHFVEIVDTSDEEFEVIPNSHFVIARSTDKSGKSQYLLNGRDVSFKVIAEKLEGYGIDLKYNRFLILQGEVEKISLMKPKGESENNPGLLEYLEDIIGTNRYRRPLLLLNQRLDRLNEERTEKHNRCRLAEQEMKDLELPKNEAVEYLKMENKMVYTQNLQFQKYVYETQKIVDATVKEKDVFVKQLEEHDTKFKEIKQQRKEKEALIQAEIKKYDDLCNKKEEFKTMHGKAKSGRDRVQQTMQSTNTRRKNLKKQLDADQKKLEDLKVLPEKNNAEIKECEGQIERLTKQQTDMEEDLSKNQKKAEELTKPLVEAKEPLENQLAEIRSSFDDMKAVYSLAEKDLEMLKKDETTERRKYETLKHNYEDQCRELEKKQEALSEVQKGIPEVKRSLEQKQQEVEAMHQQEVTYAAELQKIRLKIDENTQSMQANRSNNRVLNALMQQRQSGKIPGILGRLGDLGGIDAKFDVAISTCCGRLDNIVVDTVDTAQKCIEYLKNHNVGRATFIALEKVSHLMGQCQQRIQTPENVHRLFDLIRVEDQRVLPAFYFSLRDTLVANDLDQGSRIAYGATRYRVVTLKGDVIEMAGTMSGGGKSMIRGKMGQQVSTKTANLNTSFSERDLESLQVNAEKIQCEINNLQQQQGVLAKEIKTLAHNLEVKEKQVKALNIEVKNLTEQLPRIKDQVAKQEKKAENTKTDPAQVKELEDKVTKTKAEYDRKQKEVGVIQKKVEDLKKQIKEIQDSHVNSVKVKIQKTAKQIEKLSENINKLSVQIRQTDRNIQKTEEAIANAEQEITEAETNIRKMDEERTQFDNDVTELEKKIEEITKEIEDANTDSSTVKKEIQALQKEEDAGKLQRLEIQKELDSVDKKVKDEKKKIPSWENKLKTLKLVEIPMETEPLAPLKTYTDEELEGRKLEDIVYEITNLEEALKAKPNLGVIQEFQDKQVAFQKCVEILGECTKRRNEIRDGFDQVKKKRFQEFTDGFTIISKKLKEMYQMITYGGDAELELCDSMDPFTEGIKFSVRPPKKSWKIITNLSGGEKTLSSLALVFALHYYKPSPLYFMDEIDAALDFKNVSIIAHYINERTKNAQFIIISLRSNMFELADNLIGIYKVEDCTHSVTIHNGDKPKIADDQQNKENQNANDSLTLPRASQPQATQLTEKLLSPPANPAPTTETETSVVQQEQDLSITQPDTQKQPEENLPEPMETDDPFDQVRNTSEING